MKRYLPPLIGRGRVWTTADGDAGGRRAAPRGAATPPVLRGVPPGLGAGRRDARGRVRRGRALAVARRDEPRARALLRATGTAARRQARVRVRNRPVPARRHRRALPVPGLQQEDHPRDRGLGRARNRRAGLRELRPGPRAGRAALELLPLLPRGRDQEPRDVLGAHLEAAAAARGQARERALLHGPHGLPERARALGRTGDAGGGISPRGARRAVRTRARLRGHQRLIGAQREVSSGLGARIFFL
ncbi:uracil DNA glycosidase [Pseudocowpox virus]